MLKEKKSFFERLANSVSVEDDEEMINDNDEDINIDSGKKSKELGTKDSGTRKLAQSDYPDEEGELSVDVYQTPNEIIIEAMVAGVKPEDLHLSITRDMVTIKGRRDGNTQVIEDNYFYRELYWGSFSRSILLPHEIEIEEVEAVEKHGLLIIRLPKIDKAKQAKIKVKSI